jgi:hypothetical protein
MMTQKEIPKIINLTGADIEYAGVKIPAHEQDVGFTMLDGDPVTPVKIGSWGKDLVFLSGGVPLSWMGDENPGRTSITIK